MKGEGRDVLLWPGAAPGALPPGKADDPRAVEPPRLTLFLLGGERVRPLVVVFSGGGYRRRVDHEAEPVAAWLNGLGLHAAVCRYRVHPWQHPAPLLDAQRSIRLVRTEAASWRVDPRAVGVLGFSAGGHLACCVANFGDDGEPAAEDPVTRAGSRADALIAGYPVITFGANRHSASMQNLLGREPDPVLRQKLSLETTVTSANPPSFLWHSANDRVVAVENALLYAAALSAHRVPFALHVYPSAWHGIGLGRDFPGSARHWTGDCAAWLREITWV